MTVVVLSAVPAGLRGQLTRWLIEIAPGVFVGHIPTRIRDLLWQRITQHLRHGRALMVHSTNGEQRLAFKVHGHDWTPTDFDGIQLMMRPLPPTRDNTPAPAPTTEAGDPPPAAPRNWSSAARRRRYGASRRRS